MRMHPPAKYPSKGKDEGFVLFTTLIIMIIVGVMAVSGLKSTESVEKLAGNSLQRSRAFLAAEGGLILGENMVPKMVAERVFSSTTSEEGVFTRDAVSKEWWDQDKFTGNHTLDKDLFPGVKAPPEFVIEEIGNYVSDGGSGIVSLDRGAGSYGRKTGGGRELVLYRLQSIGVGQRESARALLESMYVQSN